MKIHELARLSKINPETIRMYRQKGLLRPEKNPANGYYEYSDTDLFSLFFIRMLRGSNVSLQTISDIFVNENLAEMLDNYDTEITNIEAQINSLNIKLDTLKLSRQHLAECNDASGEVTIMEAMDTKYDIFPFPGSPDPRLDTWLQQPELCTFSLIIKKELLNHPLPDTPLPLELGIGCYQKIIEQHQLPMLDQMSVCPKGTYLSLILELDSLTDIQPHLLKPLQQYARQHRLHFISNTTAFLIRIDYSRPKTTFLFRMRVQVAG